MLAGHEALLKRKEQITKLYKEKSMSDISQESYLRIKIAQGDIYE